MTALPYRLDLQGLRAVAVLAVMLFHFNPAWLPGGFIGVDVFLVISGFLIVSILLRKKAEPAYQLGSTLHYFYTSRLKRIAPAYFFMLVLVSLAAAGLFLSQDLDIYRKSLQKAVLFNSNNYFANFGDYFAPASHEQPLLHTWSLAVEIQFYLLAPFLVLLLPNKALKWVFATLLIGLTALAQYRIQGLGIQQATYYSLYARLPEFLAGGLVAMHLRTGSTLPPWISNLGLGLVLFAAATQPLLGPFPGLPALLPVAGAALILLTPKAGGISQQLLANKAMVWLGELSYSLYLWHWPVLALLRYYTGSQILDLPFSLLFVALTFVLATISFYCIETPLRAHRLQRQQILGYSLLISAVLATAFSMAKINQAFAPAPLPIAYQRYADPDTICHGQIVGDCLQGDLSSNQEVLVLGDSHAAMLHLFFDQLGKELGFKARIITASSCVTIPGFDYQRLPEWAQKPCLAQIEQAQKYLPQADTVFLAAFWSWQLPSPAFQKALDNFLKQETSAGKQIYLIEQEPLLKENPLRAIRLKESIAIDPAYLQANKDLRKIVNRHPHVDSLNFENTGIFKQVPFSNGEPIYYDAHHLNEIGVKQYASAATSTFRHILSPKKKVNPASRISNDEP